jgi:hypothetical protein
VAPLEKIEFFQGKKGIKTLKIFAFRGVPLAWGLTHSESLREIHMRSLLKANKILGLLITKIFLTKPIP